MIEQRRPTLGRHHGGPHERAQAVDRHGGGTGGVPNVRRVEEERGLDVVIGHGRLQARQAARPQGGQVDIGERQWRVRGSVEV